MKVKTKKFLGIPLPWTTKVEYTRLETIINEIGDDEELLRAAVMGMHKNISLKDESTEICDRVAEVYISERFTPGIANAITSSNGTASRIIEKCKELNEDELNKLAEDMFRYGPSCSFNGEHLEQFLKLNPEVLVKNETIRKKIADSNFYEISALKGALILGDNELTAKIFAKTRRELPTAWTGELYDFKVLGEYCLPDDDKSVEKLDNLMPEEIRLEIFSRAAGQFMIPKSNEHCSIDEKTPEYILAAEYAVKSKDRSLMVEVADSILPMMKGVFFESVFDIADTLKDDKATKEKSDALFAVLLENSDFYRDYRSLAIAAAEKTKSYDVLRKRFFENLERDSGGESWRKEARKTFEVLVNHPNASRFEVNELRREAAELFNHYLLKYGHDGAITNATATMNVLNEKVESTLDRYCEPDIGINLGILSDAITESVKKGYFKDAYAGLIYISNDEEASLTPGQQKLKAMIERKNILY